MFDLFYVDILDLAKSDDRLMKPAVDYTYITLVLTGFQVAVASLQLTRVLHLVVVLLFLDSFTKQITNSKSLIK